MTGRTCPATVARPREATRVLLLLLWWVWPALAMAQQVAVVAPGPGTDEEAVAAAVRALELRRFALLAAGDHEAMAPLLADDLVYTHSNGRVDTKASYLAPLRAGTTRYVEYRPIELTVRVHGTAAILVGRAQARALVSGEERRSDVRFTDVWLFRDGNWQMVAWQSTRLP